MREARRIIGLIDELRRSEPAQRAALLAKLATPVRSLREAEAARTRCGDAYRLLDETQAIIEGAEAAVAAGRPSDEVARTLRTATERRDAAEAGFAECERAAAVLRGAIDR